MTTPLIIVTGKGGVGRSALTAAISLQAAHEGRRVLAVAMTDAVGLGRHLGAASLTHEAQEVRRGVFALAIDRPAAMNEYLKSQLGVPRVALMGPLARAFDSIASAAPGIREVVTMGKVLFEVRSGRWDLVVTDAPPTGQVGSYLRAPRTVTEIVHSGRINEQAQWMDGLLGSSRLIVCALPEELSVRETTEFVSWTAAEPVQIGRVVVNRVLSPLVLSARQLDSSGAAAEAARLHSGIYHEQQIWLEFLPERQVLPFLFGATGPVEVAERLAEHVQELV